MDPLVVVEGTVGGLCLCSYTKRAPRVVVVELDKEVVEGGVLDGVAHGRIRAGALGSTGDVVLPALVLVEVGAQFRDQVRVELVASGDVFVGDLEIKVLAVDDDVAKRTLDSGIAGFAVGIPEVLADLLGLG